MIKLKRVPALGTVYLKNTISPACSIHQRPRINISAPRDQFQRIQIIAEQRRWLFATIRHYSPLFVTIRHYSHYSYYSLFAIRDYSLFAIRVFPNCFTFPPEFSRHPTSGQVFITNERVNESISRSIFNGTRTGNGFNKVMRTGNGFDKIIMYILAFKKEREILFEATRTSVWNGWNLVFAACVWDLQHNSATKMV